MREIVKVALEGIIGSVGIVAIIVVGFCLFRLALWIVTKLGLMD